MFRINTNVTALNAQRHLNNAGIDTKKVVEHLSSGLRINRAADDSAGMFVSEQMRSQIAAFKAANRNVAQAVSLLQVMEGGIEQMTGILTRLKELTIQAADGTYSPAQREKGIQVEADQLFEEMNRIVQGIKFNGISLFVPPPTSITFQVGENTIDKINFGVLTVDTTTLFGTLASMFNTNQRTIFGTSLATTGLVGGSAATLAIQVGSSSVYISAYNAGSLTNLAASINASLGSVVSATVFDFSGGLSTDWRLSVKSSSGTISFSDTGSLQMIRPDAYVQMPTIVDSFLTQIQSGIDFVVSVRAKIGAVQNRLERTGANIGIQVENTTNAESVIRDADFAAETSALVRAQILVQAGTSVLNQANLLPQNALSLLSALG